MEKFGFINIYEETSNDFLFINIQNIQAVNEANHIVSVQLVSGEWLATEFNLAGFVEVLGKTKK